MGVSIVPIKLSSVVLPPPLGPLIITNSPLQRLCHSVQQRTVAYRFTGPAGPSSHSVMSCSAQIFSSRPGSSYAAQAGGVKNAQSCSGVSGGGSAAGFQAAQHWRGCTFGHLSHLDHIWRIDKVWLGWRVHGSGHVCGALGCHSQDNRPITVLDSELAVQILLDFAQFRKNSNPMLVFRALGLYQNPRKMIPQIRPESAHFLLWAYRNLYSSEMIFDSSSYSSKAQP